MLQYTLWQYFTVKQIVLQEKRNKAKRIPPQKWSDIIRLLLHEAFIWHMINMFQET